VTPFKILKTFAVYLVHSDDILERLALTVDNGVHFRVRSHSIVFAWVLCAASLLQAGAAEDGHVLGLDNELVCRVNTDPISRRDIEDRMGAKVFELRAAKAAIERDARFNTDHDWTRKMSEAWDTEYIPLFRESWRSVVRDRLMMQAAKTEKIAIDDADYEKEVQATIDRLKEKNLLNANGYTVAEVRKIVRENMTIGRYRQKFSSIIDQPSRPEVEKYYNENISRYQRKAGVKVRLIRIDRYVTNTLTGTQTINEKALEKIEELRTNIVDYGASFSELAKTNSDDVDSRPRGGLILLDAQNPNADPFIDLDSFKNAQLVSAIRNLKPGQVSKVFEYVWGGETQRSWALAMIEDRREAGPAPLDGPMYEKIFNELQRQKSTKKEDEWFHKAIQNSMIEEVVTGRGFGKPMPMEFFFPNEPSASAPAAAPKKDEKK
jgi:hypothetical protein